MRSVSHGSGICNGSEHPECRGPGGAFSPCGRSTLSWTLLCGVVAGAVAIVGACALRAYVGQRDNPRRQAFSTFLGRVRHITVTVSVGRRVEQANCVSCGLC